jgi:hypothetical protein
MIRIPLVDDADAGGLGIPDDDRERWFAEGGGTVGVF